MKSMVWLVLFVYLTLSAGAAGTKEAKPATDATRGDPSLAAYFRTETVKLAQGCLADITRLEDWQSRREEYRRQLLEMLGLWPMPERTDLKPVITGRLEQDEFTVEKLHFQASPKLYVTANLYLPKGLKQRAPAILYVCGHSSVVTNGVSCGNKTHYRHHGAWFARNGFVCLIIDTLQLGEIQGQHRGTSREGQWWWNSRGYTPAGVEAWFGIRALDYLCSRPEVDPARIGMTGRSGGGSYTWTVAALDDRVKVAAPIAGITDLQNQVVDGALEGHCDCMFFVNTYRWDFPQVAALIAPRPLLIGNSDADRLFPLEGVVRLHSQTRRIYRLYGEEDKLGLLITTGPHADTQDLQVPVFRWFNRWLKSEDPLIEMAAKNFFGPEQLKVFNRLPADEINTRIQESFVPKAQPPALRSADIRNQPPAELLAALRQQVFAGWPAQEPVVATALVSQTNEYGLRHQTYTFESQPGVKLSLEVVQDAKVKRPERFVLVVLDGQGWNNGMAKIGGHSSEIPAEMRREMEAGKLALAFFAPRGVVPAPWSNKPALAAQVRRRFMLLGQTLDSMSVWDIRCAAEALRSLPEFKAKALCVQASGPMGVNAAYAALFEPAIERLELEQLPQSQADGPDYLNVLKVLDIPQVLDLLRERIGKRGA